MTTWTTQFKNPIDYLLLEDGFFILLESGFKIVLEQTGAATSSWTKQAKS